MEVLKNGKEVNWYFSLNQNRSRRVFKGAGIRAMTAPPLSTSMKCIPRATVFFCVFCCFYWQASVSLVLMSQILLACFCHVLILATVMPHSLTKPQRIQKCKIQKTFIAHCHTITNGVNSQYLSVYCHINNETRAIVKLKT